MTQPLCPECGRPLAANAPEGACSICLLLLGVKAPGAEGASRVDKMSATMDPAGGFALGEYAGQRIRHYHLLEPIGEGGFGTVWLAEQEEPLRRKVALKLLKLGMDARQVVARFEAERQALAMMDHPSIARVFDGGTTANGRPYFVMELVRGIPLTTYCHAARLATRDRLKLFIQVCEAVQHAHQKGIIHRDLKPTNILIAEQDGRAIPKVIDFGIAKATESVLTEKTLLTECNQMIGTPAYMSPEQAGLGGLDIDTRTDIYSLGVLLYELLSGRTPFDPKALLAAGLDEMRRTIREQEPIRPSARLTQERLHGQSEMADPKFDIDPDLDWIVLKALEKDRTRRYESANGLAADLQRYLADEPIVARPPGNLYRFQKLARRNKLLFGAAGAVAAALVLGLSFTSWWAVRATQNLAQARLNAYASEMNVAQQALAENNLERAVQLLDLQRPKAGEHEDLRGFEWRYLWQLCQGNESAIFRDGPASLYECAVAFSTDGRFLTYSGSNHVVVRDANTHKVIKSLPTLAQTLGFSPDGRLLATARLGSGPVLLWETATWDEKQVTALTNACAPAIFSPDGRWLLAGTPYANTLQLWNTETWQPVASCPQTPILDGSLRSAVAFSPDGKLLVTPWMDIVKGGQTGVYLWKVPTLEKHAGLFPPEVPFQSAAFLADGKHLVTASWLGHLLVWDLHANPPHLVHQVREHTAYIPAIAVAPGGKTLATGSADQSVCFWEASPPFKRIARWRGHRREVWAAAMSPDGETVASSSPDGTIRLWNGKPQTFCETVDDAGGDVAGFTSDGRTVVFAPSENDYRWQLVTGTNRVVIPIPAEPPLKFDFSRPYAITGNEPIAALGRSKGRVEIWDLAAKRLVTSWNAGPHRILACAFTLDGTRLATADSGSVTIWETRTRAEIVRLKAPGPSTKALAFSPDGQWLAAGSFSTRKTLVWNLVNRDLVISLNVSADQVAFAPDGKSLVTCGIQGNKAQFWELPSGRPKATLKGHVGGMVEVAFSPDGKTLATGAYDGRIKLWNIAIGQEVATFPYSGMMTSLRFSPDGRTLATGLWTSPGHRVLLFRAPSLDEIAAVERQPSRPIQP
jgi:WD40 repeat protein/serine/threonine protein kinase